MKRKIGYLECGCKCTHNNHTVENSETYGVICPDCGQQLVNT